MSNDLEQQFQKAGIFFSMNVHGEKKMLSISDAAFAYLSSFNVDWLNQEDIENNIDLNDYIIALFAVGEVNDAWNEIYVSVKTGSENFDFDKIVSSEFYKVDEDNSSDFAETIRTLYANNKISAENYIKQQFMLKVSDYGDNYYDEEFISVYYGLNEPEDLNAVDLLEVIEESINGCKYGIMHTLPTIIENYLIKRAVYDGRPIDRFFTYNGNTVLFEPTKKLAFKFMEENVIHSGFNTFYYVIFNDCDTVEEVTEGCEKIIDYIKNRHVDEKFIEECITKLENKEIDLIKFNELTWEKNITFSNIKFLSDEISIIFIDKLIDNNSIDQLLEFTFNNGILIRKPYLAYNILKGRDIDIAKYDYMHYLVASNIEFVKYYQHLPMLMSESENEFDVYESAGIVIIVNDSNPKDPVMFVDKFTIKLSDIRPDTPNLFKWIFDQNVKFDEIDYFNFEDEISMEDMRQLIQRILEIYTPDNSDEAIEEDE